MAPKIILTGFMATGKTTIARALARRIGWPLLDCDAEIARRAGKPIHEIFRNSGEAHFRALERSLIAEIASDQRRCVHCGNPRPIVVATGGGTIVDLENYAALRRCGLIVCLAARPEVIARRVSAGVKNRPMLAHRGSSLKERIAELIEARAEAYARATITVDTSDRTIDQLVDDILTAIAEHGLQQLETAESARPA